MRREPEYGKPFATYLASLVSPARIATGLHKSAHWADTLRAVEQRFAVQPTILVSIWGIEFLIRRGAGALGRVPLAGDTGAGAFSTPLFPQRIAERSQILQAGRIARQQFVGSWAGAMGQAQFMPSSYLTYAVDFDGDGRPDIWTSVPDVLASIANYLQKAGWQAGLPWGFEVVVPQKFDYRASRGTFPRLGRPRF